MKLAMHHYLNHRQQQLIATSARIAPPTTQITYKRQQLVQLKQRLAMRFNLYIKTQQQDLTRLSSNLAHLNPQSVLTRGYAFVQNQAGEIVRSTAQLTPNDEVTLTFGSGTANATINKIQE
jgi:exodeoxyribonuclease VII large subunit